MRKLTMSLLGSAMLCAATAAWAAEPAAAAHASPATLMSPASPATFDFLALTPADPLQGTPQPQPVFSFCPHPPVDSCATCYIHTFPPTQSTHICTLFCQNGVPRQVCQPCGEAC